MILLHVEQHPQQVGILTTVVPIAAPGLCPMETGR